MSRLDPVAAGGRRVDLFFGLISVYASLGFGLRMFDRFRGPPDCFWETAIRGWPTNVCLGDWRSGLMCVSGWSDIGVTLTVNEVVEVLEAAGWSGSPQVVEEFGWCYPGWWCEGWLTSVGNGFVCLSGRGLVFREAGVRLALDKFLGARP